MSEALRRPFVSDLESDKQQHLKALQEIREMTHLHSLDIDGQIERLRRIQPGWLDGEGKAINSDGLLWLQEALSKIDFDGRTPPCLYPTEEGSAQAEWTIGNTVAELRIDLETHQAVWGASDLASGEDEERELELDEENDLEWLGARLKAMRQQTL